MEMEIGVECRGCTVHVLGWVMRGDQRDLEKLPWLQEGNEKAKALSLEGFSCSSLQHYGSLSWELISQGVKTSWALEQSAVPGSLPGHPS